MDTKKYLSQPSSSNEDENAFIGITEKEAKENPDILTGEFPFILLGMAQVLGRTDGSVKIFINKDNNNILGANIGGFHAKELIRVITLAMKLNAKVNDLADLVYAHPTLSEAIGESAESALGNAIHLMPDEPIKPKEANEYDVVVVGSGPAGYVSAIRNAQLGRKVAIIEKDRAGGTCLNRGCIPSKIILEAIKSEDEIPIPEIRKRVDKITKSLVGGIGSLLEAHGIVLIKGVVDIPKSKLDGDMLELVIDNRKIYAKNVVMAMGSEPASLPRLPINHENIIDSTDALKLEVPDKLTVVGAGAIGLEMAIIFKALGCNKVTIVEIGDQICPGILDKDVADILQKKIEMQDISFDLGKGFDVENIPEGKVLVAAGRSLNTKVLSEKNISLTKKGAVEVNHQYQVKLKDGQYAKNLFAIGDIAGFQLLAHKSSKEGKVSAEAIARAEVQQLDYDQIPSVIFSMPEVAWVGLTEQNAGKSFEVKYFRSLDKKDIFKAIFEKGSSHTLLGITIIGPSAPYAIAEMSLAIKMGATLEQIMDKELTLASAKEVHISELAEKPALSTPLTEIHRELGAEIVDFHGWLLPIRYTDAQKEVSALRNNAALWDVGHMAVLEITGKGAMQFLQYSTTNDVSKLKVGQVQYSFFLDKKARPLDDILVYKLRGSRYFLVCNAANREKIKRWLFSILNDGHWKQGSMIEQPKITDLYDCPEVDKRITLISLQGPEADNILGALTDFDLDTLEYFHCKNMKIAGRKMLVQRGGYSGEEGFEIFAPVSHSEEVWQKIIESGERFGLIIAGLTARDIARQEACLPLYGNEWPDINPYDDSLPEPYLYITPYEAGFGWSVKVNKGNFIGKEAYVKHLNHIKKKKTKAYALTAIILEGRWNARGHNKIFLKDQDIGLVTSGRFSEYLGKSIWLAYVQKDSAIIGREVEIEIGKERVIGKIVPKPVVNNITYPRHGDIKENAKYYITLTPKQIDEMMNKTVGVASIDTLFEDVHSAGNGSQEFGLSAGLSHRKNYQHHTHLSKMNYSPKEYSSFLGAGSYDYKIPDVVDWAASLRGLYTPYTPYQAEVAQGLLRFFYIYQSQICQLTGMEVSNASLYDGATALAEAAFMSARITSTPDKLRNVFLLANPLHPFYYQVLETYARDLGCKLIMAPFDRKKGTIDFKALNSIIDDNISCVIVQQPNFFGQIENSLQEVAEIAHDKGALFISCTTDPHSLGVLEAPAYYGADIAVGEAQAFGNSINCGGPNLGFLATSRQYMSEIAGRIVGRIETADKETFCLIRQTREQHITRFRAKSNICSNTALCATRAALYMLAQGSTGLHEINNTILALKEFFISQLLAIPGFKLTFEGESFNEIAVRVPIDPNVINKELLKHKCLGALNLSDQDIMSHKLRDCMLFSFTNRNTMYDINRLIDSLLDIVKASKDSRKKVLGIRDDFTDEIKHSPKDVQRIVPLNLPKYSESDIIKFAKDMADLNIDIDAPLYPLGSCTMKYNPKINEKIAVSEDFSRIHPLAPDCAKQGTLKIAYDFSRYLCQITGMDAVALQPEAGAHGELTGLKVIRASHINNNRHSRKLIITSDSSHGTNPASTAMAGMEILEVPSDKYGMIDIKAFKKAIKENEDRFAGCMLTIPNTLGIFEPEISTISELTHQHGGYVYMDGANFNALIGQIKVRDLGVDVMHLNLHKTFSTPHGGGGPGAGPIVVTSELEPYLPIPRVKYDKEHNHYWLDYIGYPYSVGKVSSFFGPYGVIIKANAYRMTLGEEGIHKVSETAILNANYMLKRILNEALDENDKPLFKTIYKPGQYCMHEFVISSERFEKHDLSAADFAKGIIDFGLYAPTIGFPLFFDHGHHAIMIEPTETATRKGMDYFCKKFIELAKKAWINPEILRNAPSRLRFQRISVSDADRKLDISSDVINLLPSYTPIFGEEVSTQKIHIFAKRKVATEIESLNIPKIPEEIDPAKAWFLEEGEWGFDLGNGFVLCGLSKETAEMIKKLKFTTLHLPKLGAKIKQAEDTGAYIDFDKVASSIYAPASGRVVKINPLFMDEENLDLLVTEPYKRGWLFVVQTEETNKKV